MDIFLDSIVKYGSKSNRRIDENGYLHVTDCILTSAVVSDYRGSEIANYQQLGLDANGIYGILRPLEELKKGLETYNGLPLLDKHIAVTSQRPQQGEWIGCIGTDAKIDGDDLLNTITIWKQTAIDAIQNADKTNLHTQQAKKDLSCGYGYKLVQESGEFKGKKYHFKMIDLKGNHVALVEDGRVPDAMIADSNFKKGNKMKKSALSVLLSGFFGDKKAVDNMHIMKGIKQLADKDHEEYEGGEIEQAKAIIELARKIEASEEVEMHEDKKHHKRKMHDDDDDMDDKRVKVRAHHKNYDDKDKIEYKNMRDNEKEEKKKEEKHKAHDSVDELVKAELEKRKDVYQLCTKVVGKLSDNLFLDSCENVVDATLKLKNVAIDGKSYETKIAMLELLANQNNGSFITRIAQDSNQVKSDGSYLNDLNILVRGNK
jgi:hypothetical protein